MLVNIDLRSTFVFYLDPKILLDARGGGGGYWFRGSRTGLYGPETVCHEKIVLKIKSIVIRKTNNLFRKVNIYTHWKWWLIQLNWRFFIIFNILKVFVRWKNGKFQSPKSSTGTKLKSVISSFKSFFQNYGQLSRASLHEPGWLGWLGAYLVDLYEKFQPGFRDEKKPKILGTSSGAKFEKQSKLAPIIASTKFSARLLRSRLEKTEIAGTEPARPLT